MVGDQTRSRYLVWVPGDAERDVPPNVRVELVPRLYGEERCYRLPID